MHVQRPHDLADYTSYVYKLAVAQVVKAVVQLCQSSSMGIGSSSLECEWFQDERSRKECGIQTDSPCLECERFQEERSRKECGIQTDLPCFTDCGTQSYRVDQNLPTDQGIQCKLSSDETVSLRKECTKKRSISAT